MEEFVIKDEIKEELNHLFEEVQSSIDEGEETNEHTKNIYNPYSSEIGSSISGSSK